MVRWTVFLDGFGWLNNIMWAKLELYQPNSLVVFNGMGAAGPPPLSPGRLLTAAKKNAAVASAWIGVIFLFQYVIPT